MQKKIFVVKLINTKLRSVSHFHVSFIQQVNFLKILLLVIFSRMLYGIASHVNNYQKIVLVVFI